MEIATEGESAPLTPKTKPPQRHKPPPSWSSLVVTGARGKKPRKLLRRMMSTVDTWSLIEPGDKVMVCLSGGKDSYTLFDLLWHARQRAPFSFDLIGVHLDQAQPGYDGQGLQGWLERSGAPFEILREDTYRIVQEKTKPGQAYCFICSRLRRGILYKAAARLGCNKIALGHHRDDALETLLMNLFYAGRIQAMPARYTTDDGRFDVIRPLIECAESDIIAHAAERDYPIIPCNLCGSQDGLKRDATRDLLQRLEKEIPDLRPVMLQALRNVRPSHLLDPDLARAWSERAEDIRPWKTQAMEAAEEAEPLGCAPPLDPGQNVVARGGSLPIVPS